MAKSKKKSATGLMSEGAKKAGRGIAGMAKKAVGKKTNSRKSPMGNLSEGAKKAARGVGRAVTGSRK
jgi:hypothetical protein